MNGCVCVYMSTGRQEEEIWPGCWLLDQARASQLPGTRSYLPNLHRRLLKHLRPPCTDFLGVGTSGHGKIIEKVPRGNLNQCQPHLAWPIYQLTPRYSNRLGGFQLNRDFLNSKPTICNNLGQVVLWVATRVKRQT